MTSSENPFDVLAEASSSSKEQGTQVPFTGTESTEDQTEQDTAQAGPSAEKGIMPMEGFEDPLPHKLTIAEGVALFHKERAELEEEDRKQESRQGNSSTFVGSPIASAASRQGLRKRKVSFDKAEELSKRKRVGPLPQVRRSRSQPWQRPWLYRIIRL